MLEGQVCFQAAAGRQPASARTTQRLVCAVLHGMPAWPAPLPRAVFTQLQPLGRLQYGAITPGSVPPAACLAHPLPLALTASTLSPPGWSRSVTSNSAGSRLSWLYPTNCRVGKGIEWWLGLRGFHKHGGKDGNAHTKLQRQPACPSGRPSRNATSQCPPAR